MHGVYSSPIIIIIIIIIIRVVKSMTTKLEGT